MLRRKSKDLRGPEISVSGKGIASIVRNAGYLTGARLYNNLIRFFYAIALAYYLGPELYGVLNYGISWYLVFLSITGMGTSDILSREIGRDRESGPRIASLTLIIRGSATVIFAIVCFILGYFLESKTEVRNLLLIFSIALIGRSFSIWTENIFTAYELARYSFLLQTVFRSFEVIVGTVFLVFGGGVKAVAIVHAISWWLQALSGLSIGYRQSLVIWVCSSWRKLRDIIYKGIPNGLTLIMVIWMQSGPLVLYRHLSDSETALGQLALVMQALTIMSHVPIAAGIASLPILSRSVERQDGKDSLYSATMIKVAFVFGAAAGLGGLGIGPWIVKVLFGTRYNEAGYLLGIVMWLLIPLTCASVINAVFLAKGQFFIPTICAGLGVLVMSCIFPWTVRVMNTSGAIIATGMGMGVQALSLIWRLAKSGGLNVRETVFRPLIVIICCLGIFFVMKPVSSLLALLLSYTALLCGSVVFGIITLNEWSLIANLKKK